MLQGWNKLAAGGLVLVALLAGGIAVQPLRADGAAGTGVERGDGGTAVLGKLEGAAEQGDPEAMFRLAQAYRLGRDAPVNLARAETLYARAAAAGHTEAASTYGLMLFEIGRREAAMPYLRDAAGRGDPRAQYLMGIAYFNGDFVEVDWLRAYALMTLAKAAGLPQAVSALAEMDRALPPGQRNQAAGLADQLRAGIEAARTAQVASAPALPPALPPAVMDQASPQPASPRADWTVQLGAFSIPSNADALWNRLSNRPELQGAQRLTKTSGRLTLLQAGGFPSRESAAAACSALKRSGHDCLVSGN